jgi:peptidoglycan/LPS O-acetylase OafA/YrhL
VGALALTVILLVVLRPVARVPIVAPALGWLGQSSYGVYVGQLIVHNFFVFSFGLKDFNERVAGWPYTAVLLAGGIGFTWLGEELRRQCARLVTSRRFCERPPPCPARPFPLLPPSPPSERERPRS